MVVSINDIRVAPIGEDLTTDDLSLNVLRGIENMFRVDKKVAVGATFLKGEWAVLNGDGKAERPGGVGVGGTYLVWSGTDRFDSHATGQVTLIMSHPVIAETSRFDTGMSYNPGDYLTVKDLGPGTAYVTKWASGDARLARVTEVRSQTLVFETLGGDE